MQARSVVYTGLALAGVSAVALVLAVSSASAPAFAQPNPQPQECVCSPGVNIATTGSAVVIRHCQCGILSCAVVVASGQLQCVR